MRSSFPWEDFEPGLLAVEGDPTKVLPSLLLLLEQEEEDEDPEKRIFVEAGVLFFRIDGVLKAEEVKDATIECEGAEENPRADEKTAPDCGVDFRVSVLCLPLLLPLGPAFVLISVLRLGPLLVGGLAYVALETDF